MDTESQPDPAILALGFDHVCQLAAAHAASDPVTQRLSQLSPIREDEALQDQLKRIAEIWSMEEGSSGLHLIQYEDLEEVLRMVALKGATLSPAGFADLLKVLENCRNATHFLQRRIDTRTSAWTGILERISPLPALEDAIKRVIGPDGAVLDHASPELARLRRQQAKAAGSVRSRMQDLVKRYHKDGFLNEDRATMKGGRLVLPVVTSYKHKIEGVIQDQSNTGATTFIEPYEIIELNNHIRSLQIEEQREIERILRDLTAQFYPHAAELVDSYAALLEIDFHLALARFGKEFDASLPELNRKAHLRLLQARNPRLMLKRKVVPLELDMDSDHHTLVITGPNAGGKTVALKTIGLLALMANCGMPIPAAEGSRVPIFDRIYSDIGDQQSLVNDLSTFSAHMQTIIGIVEKASRDSLILLDELGTGTDPAEGGALARSVLEHLGAKGCKTVATTHLGELKVYAHETDHVLNGAMEFDQVALEPTYRFQAGVPGSSYGFEISRRLGLKETILKQAQEYLGAGRTTLENLLRTLEAERQETLALKTTAEALQKELSRKQRQIDSGLAKVKKAEKHANRDAARQAQEIIRETRQTVERIVRQIREEQADRETIKEAQVRLDRLETQVDSLAEEEPAVVDVEPLDPDAVKPGMRVMLTALGQIGIIVGEPGGQRVYVDVDGKRMKVPLDWLGVAPEAPQEEDATVVVNVNRQQGGSYTLDLRGYRAQAAVDTVQAFLDQAVLSNMPEVRIIHGKGTGVIRKVVHEVLDAHRAVEEFNLGGLDEGGAGVTIAKLK